SWSDCTWTAPVSRAGRGRTSPPRSRSAGSPCTRSTPTAARRRTRRPDVFEKFTDRAKRVLVLAQDEAVQQGHDFIGTEHVLVGLAGVRDTVAGDVLHDKGVTTQALREEIARVLTAAGVQSVGPQAATEALAAIGIDVEEIRRRANETFGPG